MQRATIRALPLGQESCLPAPGSGRIAREDRRLTVIIHFDGDVLGRATRGLLADDLHEDALFQLSREADDDGLLVSRDGTRLGVKVEGDHVVGLQVDANLPAAVPASVRSVGAIAHVVRVPVDSENSQHTHSNLTSLFMHAVRIPVDRDNRPHAHYIVHSNLTSLFMHTVRVLVDSDNW